MTVTNGYCSTDDVREELGDAASRLAGPVIERSINAASRAIDRYCGRRFWLDAAVTTRLFSPIDDYLCLDVQDIGSSVGLIVKTDEALTGTFARTWTATDYQLEPLNQDVVAAGDTGTAFAWWRIRAVANLWFPVSRLSRPTVSITAKFGWSAIPDDVTQACILKSVALFKRKDAPYGVAGFGDQGAIRISRSDPDVESLLAPYMLAGV
jgi:hypothetical protein